MSNNPRPIMNPHCVLPSIRGDAPAATTNRKDSTPSWERRQPATARGSKRVDQQASQASGDAPLGSRTRNRDVNAKLRFPFGSLTRTLSEASLPRSPRKKTPEVMVQRPRHLDRQSLVGQKSKADEPSSPKPTRRSRERKKASTTQCERCGGDVLTAHWPRLSLRYSMRRQMETTLRSIAEKENDIFSLTASTVAISQTLDRLPVRDGDGKEVTVSSRIPYDAVTLNKFIKKGCEGAVFDATLEIGDDDDAPKQFVNVAVKMLFNYQVSSAFNGTGLHPKDYDACPEKSLVTHPNVVLTLGSFYASLPDYVKQVGLNEFPAALPPRLCAQGYGCENTHYIVMRRYTCDLKEYLAKQHPPLHERLLLLTQLLEGVTFLTSKGVTHRDLKVDNLLVDTTCATDGPWLVIADFGHMLETLHLCYRNDNLCIGGNDEHRPPEIRRKLPGPDVKLDYWKADLWAADVLAYEILGAENPFSSRLSSMTYNASQLAPLKDSVPEIVRHLVRGMLQVEPKEMLMLELKCITSEGIFCAHLIDDIFSLCELLRCW